MTYHGADPSTFDSGALATAGTARHGEIMRLKIRASSTSILCQPALVRTVLSLFALFLIAGTAEAQLPVQYTPPGGPREKPESRREELEHEIAAARYHLGPVRIAPWVTVRDVAYVRSLLTDGQQQLPNDLTATAGLGFRAYLRNGSKATWKAQVLPEYVWWRTETGRRQLNGRYLLGYSAFFNHLTVEAQAGRQQQQQIVTPEVPVPVSSRSDGGEILTELRISGSVSLFASAAFNRQSNLTDDIADPLTGSLRLLDREERVERLGVRWRPVRRLTLGLAGEHSETDFRHQGAFDRSNSGDAPVAEIRFRGNHLAFEAEAEDRSLSARRGAEIVPFHGVTGTAAVTLGGPKARTTWTVYSNRNLVYSLSTLYPYLTDQRLGTALTTSLGQRTTGRVFVEGGRNDYTAFSATAPRRHEDVYSYGGSLSFSLRRALRLGIEGIRSHYGSNLAGGSRSYTSVGATFTLSELP
jgi:hypothetical protein